MDYLQEYCKQQIRELDVIIKDAEHNLLHAPHGTLYISNNRNQYYWREDPKNTNGTYIKRSERLLAEQLAQKTYAQKVLSAATKKRKKLITPYILPDDEFIRAWEENENKKKMLRGEMPISKGVLTEKGELVRSKSEVIIADKLYRMNIPYVYEPVIHFESGRGVVPDFIALNVRTREAFYWEHFGMLGNSDYVHSAIIKIEQYERNHIFPGDKLIVTCESDTHVLDTKIVDMLITNYLT